MLKFKHPDEKTNSGVTANSAGPVTPSKANEKAFDYYELNDLLSIEERGVRDKVRAFVDTEIRPIIADYWEKDETPLHLLPKLATLNLAGGSIKGYGCPGLSVLATGISTMELNRGDGSMATLFGVNSGLAMYSIAFCGSEEQKQEWLPKMARMEKFGAFGLTEPFVGSDAAHIQTTARRDGDYYVLNGAKRWIGGATIADVVIVWAQDDQTGQVGGFLVEKDTPGFTPTKISHKLALRALPNADIKFENCIIPAKNKLVHAHSFRDTAKVLLATRVGVAWGAIGHAQAAFEYAFEYAKKRQQFGRPIAQYQLIQEKFAWMLAELESMKLLTWRLSKLAEDDKVTDGQASLAKMNNSKKAREIVALAREIMGGNGILIENHVARHFADMEAVYTYEGTNEINTLVVGREITGLQAFV